MFEQQIDHCRVSLLGGQMQRRVAHGGPRTDHVRLQLLVCCGRRLRALAVLLGGEQALRYVALSAVGRLVERREAGRRGTQRGVRSSCQQQLHGVRPVSLRGQVQSGEAILQKSNDVF